MECDSVSIYFRMAISQVSDTSSQQTLTYDMHITASYSDV